MVLRGLILLILGVTVLFGLSKTGTETYITPDEKVPEESGSKTTTLVTATTTAEVTATEPVIPVLATTTKPSTTKNPTATTTSSPAITIPKPAPNFEVINTETRNAIVNILCSTKGGELNPISGTGIVVGSGGLVLTNAHIAQYFLLKDFRQKDFIECVVRTGSPAYPKYKVELVYISPAWVDKNKAQLKEENPTGTGENDFAFLRITENIDGSALPLLPFLTMNIREFFDIGEPTLLASYPAGFLGGISVLQNLSITSAIAKISEYFTFKESTIDLISVPGTVVSQKGSSGGAVVDADGTLVGVISTSSNSDTTSGRDLRAITLAYINRSLQTELGMNLVQFTSLDMSVFAKNFQETKVPALTKLIEDELNKTN